MDGLSECRFFIRKRMKDKSETYTYMERNRAFAEAHDIFVLAKQQDGNALMLKNVAWGVEIDGKRTILESFDI